MNTNSNLAGILFFHSIPIFVNGNGIHVKDHKKVAIKKTRRKKEKEKVGKEIKINNEKCFIWKFWPEFMKYGIGPVARVFANDPGDLGSIPGRVIPKTIKNGT